MRELRVSKIEAVDNGGFERIWKGNVALRLKQNPSTSPCHLSFPYHLKFCSA